MVVTLNNGIPYTTFTPDFPTYRTGGTLCVKGYASRLAMELGVDIIKTFYTGSPETFARVVDMVRPALVVAAGGPDLDSDLAVLEMARNVVQADAAGVTFGRNIWQSQSPTGVMKAFKTVIHNGMSPQAAFEKFVSTVQS